MVWCVVLTCSAAARVFRLQSHNLCSRRRPQLERLTGLARQAANSKQSELKRRVQAYKADVADLHRSVERAESRGSRSALMGSARGGRSAASLAATESDQRTRLLVGRERLADVSARQQRYEHVTLCPSFVNV